MEKLGWVAAYVVLMFFSACWSGYMFSVIWSWFVVPIFALPALTLNNAIGLSLVIRFFTTNYNVKDDRSNVEKFASQTVNAIFIPLIILAYGYIVRLFA